MAASAQLSKDRLKGMQFLKELQYPQRLEAESIIEKGADLALLYFWFNLIKANYYPVFSQDMVNKQAVYFAERDPEFQNDIIKWVTVYETIIANKDGKVESKA